MNDVQTGPFREKTCYQDDHEDNHGGHGPLWSSGTGGSHPPYEKIEDACQHDDPEHVRQQGQKEGRDPGYGKGELGQNDNKQRDPDTPEQDQMGDAGTGVLQDPFMPQHIFDDP